MILSDGLRTPYAYYVMQGVLSLYDTPAIWINITIDIIVINLQDKYKLPLTFDQCKPNLRSKIINLYSKIVNFTVLEIKNFVIYSKTCLRVCILCLPTFYKYTHTSPIFSINFITSLSFVFLFYSISSVLQRLIQE